jgi:GcrA cell cycle regulator
MSGWTDKRIERLCKLWNDGLSASQVAKELGGGITKNAVIGKIHRLGLAHRAAAVAVERNRYPAVRPPAPSKLPKLAMLNPAAPLVPPEKAVAPIASAPDAASDYAIAIPESGRVTLLELHDSMCRWPIGHPREAGFGFCGAKSPGGGSPYCAYHAQIAYTTPAEAKRAADEWRKAHGKAARAA